MGEAKHEQNKRYEKNLNKNELENKKKSNLLNVTREVLWIKLVLNVLRCGCAFRR